jgi:2-C-methyl-D-erythritol 4-phosphate cytidylyltransferase
VAGTVVLVVPAASLDDPDLRRRADVVVAGGATRAESVRAGLAASPAADVIVVHDAARPLASPELFVAVVAAVRAGADAAVPTLAISDTVKRVEGDRVVATVDRRPLATAQTPQAFRAEILRKAHEARGEAPDDAGLVELLGGLVAAVPGEPRNLKVTSASDLAVLEAWIGA